MTERANRSSGHHPTPQTHVRQFQSRESSFGWSIRTLSPISLRAIESPSFRNTPPKQTGWKVGRWRTWRGKRSNSVATGAWSTQLNGTGFFCKVIRSARLKSMICLLGLLAMVAIFFGCVPRNQNDSHTVDTYEPLMPMLRPSDERATNPTRWLRENSNNKHAVLGSTFHRLQNTMPRRRPRAAITSLVRNTELEGITQSMRQLEYR